VPDKKFRGKYRIDSARLKNWDYGQPGAYFVTIVTKNREHFFGEIVDGEMVLSDIGQIAQQYWSEIPRHFSFIRLDEMVVMPNHIHGILWIERDTGTKTLNAVETLHATSLPHNDKNKKMAKISPKRGSLATVIRSFKSAVTMKSRCKYATHGVSFVDFAWQPRFHDRIIRNDDELGRIRHYIRQNPKMWERDRNKAFKFGCS